MPADTQGVTEELVREAERIREDAQVSMKAHWDMAARWALVARVLGCSVAVLAALGSAAFFEGRLRYLAAFALLSSVAAAVNTALGPSSRAAACHAAGASYASLRDRARVFSTISVKREDPATDALHLELRQLCERRDELRAASPAIARWAHKRAVAGIDRGEAAYSVDSR